MIRKLLIANRGEIAVRIIRACREMGIASVAVYSEADRDALHTKLADEAICIGPAAAKDSYLSMEQLISATITSGADAIHPGFGFLSENSRFAGLCQQCGITFVGPHADIIARLGNKQEAKNTMSRAGVPVIPGSHTPIRCASEGKLEAEQIGYPVMIKAALGGGGKGMRTAWSPEEFDRCFAMAQKESRMAFGDDTMYIEHFVQHPKHIEVQILADAYGHVVHLGERDCSIQRNHQKLIEESPCDAISPALRKKMGEAAVQAAKAAGYVNAGTIEFLLDGDGHFYFMEMNTRIQVEHPVTEWVTGIDLIKEQIRIASGEPLGFTQMRLFCAAMRSSAVSTQSVRSRTSARRRGQSRTSIFRAETCVRIDSAVYRGYTVPPWYDSMLAKLIVWGKDREEAIQRMRSALGEIIIEGIETNVDYQYGILQDPDYCSGKFDVEFLNESGKSPASIA